MTPQMISFCERLVGDYVNFQTPYKIIFAGQDIPSDATIYVRFHVVASKDTQPIGIGKNVKRRNVGVLKATIHGPKGHGAGEIGDLAFDLWKKLHGEDYAVGVEGKLTTKEGGFINLGTQGEEIVYVTDVPYEYDFDPNAEAPSSGGGGGGGIIIV